MLRKRILTALFSASLLALPQMALADETIRITVDGSTLDLEGIAPVMQNDRVLSPFRAIAEKLGAVVSFDDATQTVSAKKDGTELSFVIGQKTMNVNGQAKALDVAPTIIGKRTFLPARAFAEELGANVGWYNNTVLIGTNPEAAQTLLIQTTEASAKLNSYGFDGTMKVKAEGAGLFEAMDMDMKFTGAIMKPLTMHMTYTVSAPGVPDAPKENIEMEVLMKDGKYYMKPSGAFAEILNTGGQWIDMGLDLPADLVKDLEKSQSPEEAVKQIKAFGLKAISGGEKTIKGVTYKVIQLQLNQNILPMLQQLNSSASLPNTEDLTFNYFYTYYINPQTLQTELMDLSGTQTMKVEDQTMTMTMNGTMTMKDFDKNFTFPDVSKAIALPTGLPQ